MCFCLQTFIGRTFLLTDNKDRTKDDIHHNGMHTYKRAVLIRHTKQPEDLDIVTLASVHATTPQQPLQAQSFAEIKPDKNNRNANIHAFQHNARITGAHLLDLQPIQYNSLYFIQLYCVQQNSDLPCTYQLSVKRMYIVSGFSSYVGEIHLYKTNIHTQIYRIKQIVKDIQTNLYQSQRQLQYGINT